MRLKFCRMVAGSFEEPLPLEGVSGAAREIVGPGSFVVADAWFAWFVLQP